MKSWQTLTPRGKLLRLRQTALTALREYDLEIKRLRIAGSFTNLVLRADDSAGRAWMVRVCAPNWRTDTDIAAEMSWLAFLQHSDIPAPVPLFSREGKPFVYAAHPGLAAPQRVTVQSWLPGTLLEKQMTEPNLVKMGTLFAQLHTASLRFTPPEGFSTRTMRHYLARDEEDVLFSEDNLPNFPEGSLEIYRAVHEKVMAAFQQRYAGAEAPRAGYEKPSVIHNDLWHGNIKVYRGRLYPFDFEDTIWGYPVQDAAMAMQDVMDDQPPEQYEPLFNAFRRGYERLCPWMEQYEGEMDLFRAGRMLWVANFVARFENEYFADYISRHVSMLRDFLETGTLRKPLLLTDN